MNARCICVKFLLAFAVALIAPSLWAYDGLAGVLPNENLAAPLNLPGLFGQKLAITDFDNDHKPDAAVLVNSGPMCGQKKFRIELHLSGSDNSELTFQSSETALAITTSDINHDGTPDVVVEQSFTHKRLHVWLGDGHGGFRKVRAEDFPSAEASTGEQMKSPSPLTDCPALSLPQQRETEMAILAACFLRGRPPSTYQFAGLSLNSSAISRPFFRISSRAPPRYFL